MGVNDTGGSSQDRLADAIRQHTALLREVLDDYEKELNPEEGSEEDTASGGAAMMMAAPAGGGRFRCKCVNPATYTPKDSNPNLEVTMPTMKDARRECMKKAADANLLLIDVIDLRP